MSPLSSLLFRLSSTAIPAIAAKRRAPSDAPGRTLVVQLGDIGDLVMSSAFLRELRRHEPDAKIDLVVKPGVGEIVNACPYVDRSIAFPAHRSRWAGGLSGLGRARRFARSELGGAYESAWHPRVDLDELGATFLAAAVGPSRLISYSETTSPAKAERNRNYDRMLTQAVTLTPGASRHEVDRLLGLIESAEGPVLDRSLELWITKGDRSAAAEMLGSRGGPLIAVGIGAGHPKRRWPVARFASLAKDLSAEMGATFVVVGAGGDGALGEELRNLSGAPVLNLAGHTTLGGSAAIIASCSGFVGNDSGPMHIAAAAGLPVVEISCHPLEADPEHPNSPERFGPYGCPARIVRPDAPAAAACRAGCAAAEPHCIERITAPEVTTSALELFSELAQA